MKADKLTAEENRLRQDGARFRNWKRWGPYLPERQWGTVREDYSPDGDAWNYFPHEHARSRAYRWGEDGLLGLTDRECRLCFAVALWNGKDPILKERLYGLSNPEGNHGEDCKELYYYLDSTPTHSYCRALYKYPQAAFPYEELRTENARRGRNEPEYEIFDTGVFDHGRYFDVFVEYAKAAPDDVLIRITAFNRGQDEAPLHLLPTFWFRNTWIWGCRHEGCTLKPRIARKDDLLLVTEHESLGTFLLSSIPGEDVSVPQWLFTENESNSRSLWGTDSYTPYTKDAFHRRVVDGDPNAVNPAGTGTKACAWYRGNVTAGRNITLRLRICAEDERDHVNSVASFDRIMAERVAETEEYYAKILPSNLDDAERLVMRQAAAGLLWTKQFYHYSVADWLLGDPDAMSPPESRLAGRNTGWQHFFSRDILSMPDKWEYPWFASWDTAFHMIPFAILDPAYAKNQLVLMLREWYMHPNGQLPAYEFAFDDVNPPVHAWSCWRVYKMTGERGKRDREFLERAFHKLLLNFTWWVNRKDPDGRNIFSGGFLGLDNIGLFDRSRPLPTGGHLQQADGTAWMAFYCVTMLAIALELAEENPAYEDIASKFFEHFVGIVDAMNTLGGTGLWDEQDGFYYDHLRVDSRSLPLKIRSIVGLIPLFAVEVLHGDKIGRLTGFRKRMEWFLTHRNDLARHVSWMECAHDMSTHQLLAVPSRERLERVLRYMLDESEFLAPYGIRSLSRHHEANPYTFTAADETYTVRYLPGESDSGLFGGNSNWRGPIWMPLNYLLIEALERYHHFYGDTLQVEFPTGSGRRMTLAAVAGALAERLVQLFVPDEQGRRPCHGAELRYAGNVHFRDLVLFHEYFHPENGTGLGATHQTGWTALAAKLIADRARSGANSR